MANPPISIPPFSNVPAPGSPIRSDWPQQITQYVVDMRAVVDAMTPKVNTLWAQYVPQAAWIGVTTNAQGSAVVTYGLPYSGDSRCIAICPSNGAGDPAGWVDVVVFAATPTSFSFQASVRNQNPPFINASILLQYIAVGPR